MYITAFEIENFRNIEQMKMYPSENVNVIYGENAQGKTNVLEAIWTMTGCKSFRNAKDSETVAFNNPKAVLDMKYIKDGEKKNLKTEIIQSRSYSLNGIKLDSRAEIIGEIKQVVFSPNHLNLIKQGPSERRKFLDTAIGQLKPNYKRAMRLFNHLMKQRNAIIVEAQDDPIKHEMLCILEEEMAEAGAYIVETRMAYIQELKIFLQEIYTEIAPEGETIDLKYVQPFGSGRNFTTKKEFVERLIVARKGDVNYIATSVGPHRDDMEILISDKSSKKFASQGQQKTAALALKLAEASMIEKFSDDVPIILLDDVTSELDIKRQDYILNQLENRQVFISCCDPNVAKNFTKGRFFEIEKGKIISAR